MVFNMVNVVNGNVLELLVLCRGVRDLLACTNLKRDALGLIDALGLGMSMMPYCSIVLLHHSCCMVDKKCFWYTLIQIDHP